MNQMALPLPSHMLGTFDLHARGAISGCQFALRVFKKRGRLSERIDFI